MNRFIASPELSSDEELLQSFFRKQVRVPDSDSEEDYNEDEDEDENGGEKENARPQDNNVQRYDDDEDEDGGENENARPQDINVQRYDEDEDGGEKKNARPQDNVKVVRLRRTKEQIAIDNEASRVAKNQKQAEKNIKKDADAKTKEVFPNNNNPLKNAMSIYAYIYIYYAYIYIYMYMLT
jgi:hypothetical protein